MDCSQLIAELRGEIAELRKRVSVLEEKVNQKEIKDLEDVSKLSLICVFEPNTSCNLENACEDVDQCPVQDLPDSSSVSPVCDFIERQDSVSSDAEQHSASALYPNISSVCTALKKELNPTEIPGPAGVKGIADRLALEEMDATPVCKNECCREVSLGPDCDGETEQTALKVCSVKLVDCGEMLKQDAERAKASSKRRHLSSIKKIRRGNLSNRRIECSVCGKTLASASMKAHMSVHSGMKTYQCSQCGRKFNYSVSYKRHMKIHERQKLLQNLNKHNALQIRQLGYPCTVCGKVLSYSNSLKNHMRMHTGEKPYKCSYCGLTFTHRCSYVSHLKHHTKQQTYTCTYCRKQFVFKFSFKEHVRMHTGEKPYQCAVCEKRFTHLSTFKRHLHKHKTYSCNVCSESFTHKVRFVAHQSLHTGVRQNVCSQCGKQFLMPAHLKNHERIHAKKNTECNVEYQSKV